MDEKQKEFFEKYKNLRDLVKVNYAIYKKENQK